MKKLIIAIDGPAGSGKSSTAKKVADKLGYLYIDTGAMYRAVTWLALEKNISDYEELIIANLKNCDLRLEYSEGKTRVFIDELEVTDKIRTPLINSRVSSISAIPGVRQALVEKQRHLGKSGGVVMEGRDIGTVVFPDADLKIYMTASIDKRAERRFREVNGIESGVSFEEIRNNIVSRDKVDSSRDVSPLTKASDAIEIDTSDLTLDEQVEAIVKLASEISELKLTGSR